MPPTVVPESLVFIPRGRWVLKRTLGLSREATLGDPIRPILSFVILSSSNSPISFSPFYPVILSDQRVSLVKDTPRPTLQRSSTPGAMEGYNGRECPAIQVLDTFWSNPDTPRRTQYIMLFRSLSVDKILSSPERAIPQPRRDHDHDRRTDHVRSQVPRR